jgi:hypothetical protein
MSVFDVWPAICISLQIMKMNLSDAARTRQPVPRSTEATTIVKIVGAGITGVLAYVAAMLTTVVEAGGFWQYFWLGICILFFISAMALVILASRDGIRLDHVGLSFEPHDRGSVAGKAAMKEDRPPGLEKE